MARRDYDEFDESSSSHLFSYDEIMEESESSESSIITEQERSDLLRETIRTSRRLEKSALWIPEVEGVRITSVEQLYQIINQKYPGLLEHNGFQKMIHYAQLHLELVSKYGHNNPPSSEEVTKIAERLGLSRRRVKSWLIECAKPRIYHYMTLSPLKERRERVEAIFSALNGIRNMNDLEKRLRTLYYYDQLASSTHHQKNVDWAEKFFEFLSKYQKGGLLCNLVKTENVSKSAAGAWLKLDQLPVYPRLASSIPEEMPPLGKKWLPLKLNIITNLPESFIEVPTSICSVTDIKGVLQQLHSVQLDSEPHCSLDLKIDSFFYLLGLTVSDGSFSHDSSHSAKLSLYATKNYVWADNLGRAFCNCMNQLGISAKQMQDDVTERYGTNSVFSVWSSEASPLLMWIKCTALGLQPSSIKKDTPIDAAWILKMPTDLRVAFVQGLADGDGYSSIRSFNAGIATVTNHAFYQKVLDSLGIHSRIEKTKVRIHRYDDIKRANHLPLFRHATGRQTRLDELDKIIDARYVGHAKVPSGEIQIIMEYHKRGFSCGLITEMLWTKHGIARTRKSIEGIIRRRKSRSNS